MRQQFRDTTSHLIALLLLFTFLGTIAGCTGLGMFGLWKFFDWVER